MTGRPSDAELAAIAAAYVVIARRYGGAPAADLTRPSARWARAARLERDELPGPPDAGRRSAWRDAARP